ncbi:MAG: hypothetical protein ACETWK_01480 [Candidatus Aminicenantaceae bacterium]
MKKRLQFTLFILFIGLCFGFAEAQEFQITFSGGVNHVFEYGSENDYELGKNDFPVTPAHTPLNFGAAFAYYLTDKIAIKLDGKYISASKITVTDPSDNDTAKINTSKHFSITLNFIYHFSGGRLRPYFVLGGGIDKLLAKEENYISEYGYEITFLVPEKTVDPMGQVGGGVYFFLSSSIGAEFDVRYVLIFSKQDNVSSLGAYLGIFIRF